MSSNSLLAKRLREANDLNKKADKRFQEASERLRQAKNCVDDSKIGLKISKIEENFNKNIRNIEDSKNKIIEDLNEKIADLNEKIDHHKIKLNPLRNAILNFHPESPDDISPSAFEKYVGSIYRLLGFKVTLIGGTGDQGVDVIASADQERIAIQVKRYGFDNHVGVSAVQEVFTGKAIYNCQKAEIVTTSTFTKAAIEMAKQLDVKCLDRDAFHRLVRSVFIEST
jgi:restriction endonuclease Mrr